MLIPYYAGKTIDLIDKDVADNIPQIFKNVILIASIVAGGALSQLIMLWINNRISYDLITNLKNAAYGKIRRLPISYIDTHSHGDIMSRMTNDAENIANIVSSSLSSLLSGMLMLIGTIAMMLSYSPLLTLLSCSTVMLTVVFTTNITRYMRKYFVKRQELLGKLNGTVEEMVTNTRTVTAYNRQAAEVQ
jgi:ATP-binding cassette subfamily B protein